MNRKFYFLFLAFVYLGHSASFSQHPIKKYQSLLWEITGNGLSRPSYLFGTMHVSSKMVFHLPDSFYLALKNVDAVALELNPDKWQGQMVRLDQLEQNYRKFIQGPSNDYLNEKSFQFTEYDDELKSALSSDPTVVNSLLYRSMKTKEDFEEDTFLDLYIFQTGKKLGKRATGVEDYYETEKIILEAYGDMAKEKNKKNIDTDGESMYDIDQKLQEAYRHGDLNTLDSLDNMIERSTAFRDKFLYKRNEIQANSMDTIMKKSSLFVGVGAAHLPGNRGIIELLRKKGYILRPVLMADKNADERDKLDKIKVPVAFRTNTSDDGFYSVDMPGPLYKMATDLSGLDRRQYSDMSNGTYYLVTRVKTHAAFLGIENEKVIKRIDSLLYENIPGKILSKSMINNNGYPGFDIQNKTRRGDMQHYQVFVSPDEVLIFKISGKENYVTGPEAERFFSSIHLSRPSKGWRAYSPAQGGFTVTLPGQPTVMNSAQGSDGMPGWEYSSQDNATGSAYIILKKNVNNFRFLEEDTFDLSLVEESFKHSIFIEKQLERNFITYKGYPGLDLKEKMKDGSFVKARILLDGSQYFLLAAHTRNENEKVNAFFSSFSFLPYLYSPGKIYTDTFLHYSVVTPFVPEIEQNLRALIEKIGDESPSLTTNSYWPKARNAIFKSDSTGEMIAVTTQQYPKYYYSHDSSNYWHDQVTDYMSRNDLYLSKKDSFTLKDNSKGFDLVLTDTNSTRTIRRRWILKDDRMYRLATLTGITPGSTFINDFFNTFRPETGNGRSIFHSTIDDFLKDYYSTDSTTHAKAASSISNVYYDKKDIPKLLAVIRSLKYGEKDYFDSKLRFIAELGYIHDTAVNLQIVKTLKELYDKAGDTTSFQNKVIQTLAKQRSSASYSLLKKLLVQDPPVFETDYEYNAFFSDLTDSLALTKTLLPDLLQLYTIDDYRDNINSLIISLLDSNLVTGKDYEGYFTRIWFDARIELKKQSAKDEKKMEQESNKENDPRSMSDFSTNSNSGSLPEYSRLLIPFYDLKPPVPNFFQKLLSSRDESLQLKTAVLLLANHHPVADSVLLKLAAKDKYRSILYKELNDQHLADKFPLAYKNQLDMARSLLIQEKEKSLPDSIVYLDKQHLTIQNKRGNVYFFKYRFKKDEEWKIGISGLQPEKPGEISTDSTFVKLTDKRIKEDSSLDEQLQQQLKRLIYANRKSSKSFYEPEGYSRFRHADDN